MSYALIGGAFIAIIAAFLGYYLKSKIWKSENIPTTVVDYGRKFSSYMILIIPVSSIHFFVKEDLTEAMVKSSVSIIAFLLISFFLGIVYGFFKLSLLRLNLNKSEYQSITTTTKSNVNYKGAMLLVILVLIGIIFYMTVINVPNNITIDRYAASEIATSTSIIQNNTEVKKSNWVPIAKFEPQDASLSGDQIALFDVNSIRRENEFYIASYGRQNYTPTGDATNFMLYILQVDCANRKYRPIKSIFYEDSNVDVELKGNKTVVDDYQKEIANWVVKNGGNYDGGWSTYEYAQKNLIKFKDSVTKVDKILYVSSQKDISILKMTCNF
jgi:hypothetical protein